jgi:guanine deaminase
MCLAALYWAKVDKVYYCCLPEDANAAGFDNVRIARHLQQPFAAQPLKSERITALHQDALDAYRQSTRSAAE